MNLIELCKERGIDLSKVQKILKDFEAEDANKEWRQIAKIPSRVLKPLQTEEEFVAAFYKITNQDSRRFGPTEELLKHPLFHELLKEEAKKFINEEG